MRSHKRRTKKDIVLTVLTVVFSAMLVVSLGGLAYYTLMMQSAHNSFEALADQVQAGGAAAPAGGSGADTEAVPAAYAQLHEQNEDFVGWISLEGTGLNYPVMHTPGDSQHYLRRNFEDKYSLAGTPFLDARCGMEEGSVLIVYGHNMNDGSMFAPLVGYMQQDYAAQHPVIRMDSLTRQREFEFMGVLKVKDSPENARDYYAVPTDQAGFEGLVSRLQGQFLYDTGVTASWGDQLLLLSTCDSRDSTIRILIVARRAGA